MFVLVAIFCNAGFDLLYEFLFLFPGEEANTILNTVLFHSYHIIKKIILDLLSSV